MIRLFFSIAMMVGLASIVGDACADTSTHDTAHLDDSLDTIPAFQDNSVAKPFPGPFYLKKHCAGLGGIHTRDKVVALTFDDGPSKPYTSEILRILKDYQVRATFFVVGRNVLRYPDVLEAEVKDGHTIGIHSYSHPRFSKLSKSHIRQELALTSGLVLQFSGIYPLLFRPPYGACSALSTAVIQEMGYTTIMWADDANDFDFKGTSVEQIVKGIIVHTRPGRIILLHDGGGNRSKTVTALPLILDALKAKGYHVITLQDLLELSAYR